MTIRKEIADRIPWVLEVTSELASTFAAVDDEVHKLQRTLEMGLCGLLEKPVVLQEIQKRLETSSNLITLCGLQISRKLSKDATDELTGQEH